ncbi:MAG TPA: hypothetical protein VMA36_21735 [Candidatus Limnocylindria bacterium]|nr:hypothetical protein [Candidatus Limnocylindria bacterium]
MRVAWVFCLAVSLVGCGGKGLVPGSAPPPIAPPLQVGYAVDQLGGTASCRVTADGFLWYTVPSGTFAPLEVSQASCPGGTLGVAAAPVPSWARPAGATQALLTVASLVGSSGDGPIAPLAAEAKAAGVPVTWLLDRPWTGAEAAAYDAQHAGGDDVQVAPNLTASAQAAWNWYRPSVAVLGAGGERDITGTLAAGDRAFWGITWNSSGVDATSDRGAPWGLYCADPGSYKRPAPSGDCGLASIEWTARDLTTAYETSREDAYSTDPEDLRVRAMLDPATAAAYMRQLVDAYAAAGATTPLLLVAHEEATDFATATAADTPIVDAIYREARADGMTATTLAGAVTRLAPSAANPRVVAFPALALSGRYGPATIDAHDAHVGLTFRAGETLPARVFAYDRETTSAFDVPVPQLSADEMPTITSAAASGGVLTLHLRAPVATRFGLAFWTDPALAGWTSPNVFAAGHAGAVALFDLVAGDNTITLGCRACTSTTFPYSS